MPSPSDGIARFLLPGEVEFPFLLFGFCLRGDGININQPPYSMLGSEGGSLTFQVLLVAKRKLGRVPDVIVMG